MRSQARGRRAGTAAVVATTVLVSVWSAGAAATVQRLQGIFCNGEAQIDAVMSLIADGAPATSAVAVMNGDVVSCTLVDLLEFVVADAVEVGRGEGGMRQVRYRANLVGVVVGDRMRPVSPPAVVYFVPPAPITAPAERES